MKKRKLKAELEYNFALYGMLSALKEYKLAWQLNSKLSIELYKQKDIRIEFLNSQNLIISNFLFETEHSICRLLKNKSVDQFEENSTFLIPELNRFDYLILVQGFEDTFNGQELKQILNSIPKVQYVQSFDVDTLKSRENLIF